MSLESKLLNGNMNSFLGQLLYHKNPKRYLERYRRYYSNSNMGEIVADETGRILFGGKHGCIKQIFEESEKPYIIATEKEEGLEYVYSENGSIAFGSPHRWVVSHHTLNNQAFIYCKHGELLEGGFVREDGSVAYGGFSHFGEPKFETINGIDYLVEIIGDKKRYLSEDGAFYPDIIGPILLKHKERLDALGLWSSLCNSSSMIYDKLLCSEDDKDWFIHKVGESFDGYVKENKDNPDHLEKVLRQFVLCLKGFANHPESLFSFIGKTI